MLLKAVVDRAMRLDALGSVVPVDVSDSNEGKRPKDTSRRRDANFQQ